MTVGRSMAEPLKLHTPLSEAQRQQAVSDLADRVHLPKASLQRFPHELSGGQLQRVCIARAIASKPRLLVLDEPTSSLDLSVRAGILELLDAIRKETGVALLLISHDLETVELMTQRLLVLYLGKVVEQGPTREIFNNPAHPYTQTLMSAHLPADPKAVLSRLPTVGEIPSPLNLPSGCLFSSRCPLVRPQCQQVFPSFFTLNGGPAHAAAHDVACNRVPDATNWLSSAAQRS
jgi:oligopeptide/dipeptide ABC transporter ATP-binding protein